MHRKIERLTNAVLMMAALAAPAAARAADDAKTDKPVVDEILAILKERGDIDEGEYQRLVAKNAEHEKKEGWIDRVRIFGDLRSRYEGFWYDKDELSNFPNRFRGRYRARLGAEAPINDYVSAVMRIATSEGDNRSENQSFGRNAPDFNYDGVVWDWGYIQFKSKEGQLPAGGIALAQAGKTPNPFIGHFGREKMLWDPDITLEGAIVKLSAAPWKDVKLFANGGYSIIDENWAPVGENKDPNLITAQLGAEWKLLRDWSTGARFTWFGFRSLDPSFVQRGVNGSTASGAATNSAGNIPDGLTGNVNGGHMGVGEIQAYLTWSGLEAWPVTIAGGMSDNFSAQASQLFPGVGRDAFAWNAGIEFGDKAQWVQLGATYYWVEANAFPSMYIDSDTLDGITNRKGWAFTGTRQLFTNTDLSLSLFSSDSINATLPGEQFSIPGSQRFRLQADVEVKF